MPGDRACDHLLADQSEGIIWYASDTFLRVADDILGLPEEAFEETLDYFQSSYLTTDKGRVDSNFMMEAVTAALREKRFNVVGFDIDTCADGVHQLFIAEEIPDDVKFRPLKEWELPSYLQKSPKPA